MSKMDWVEAAAENPEAKRRWLVGIVASAASAVHLGPWACIGMALRWGAAAALAMRIVALACLQNSKIFFIRFIRASRE